MLPELTAAHIDATLLATETTSADIERLCADAATYAVAAVCVPPNRITVAAQALAGTDVDICTVANFPTGTTPLHATVEAILASLYAGAVEIDVVAPVGRILDGATASLVRAISTYRAATDGAVLKVIVESALLDDTQLTDISRICADAGVDYVKTSTGMHPAGGATIHAVETIRDAVEGCAHIKASGGIRDAKSARELIAAGATRIGTSNPKALLTTV